MPLRGRLFPRDSREKEFSDQVQFPLEKRDKIGNLKSSQRRPLRSTLWAALILSGNRRGRRRAQYNSTYEKTLPLVMV